MTTNNRDKSIDASEAGKIIPKRTGVRFNNLDHLVSAARTINIHVDYGKYYRVENIKQERDQQGKNYFLINISEFGSVPFHQMWFSDIKQSIY